MGVESATRTIRAIAWLWAIVQGALQAWMYRYSISSWDAVSYLDIADAYLKGDWNAAINAHWSPLYSWILALALLVFDPSPYWELPVLKLVNFLIFLCALLAFDFFLRTLIAYNDRLLARHPHSRFLQVPNWAWLVMGYLLFLWSSLNWTTLYSDTPDMTTAVFVYLAAAMLLRAHLDSDRWATFVLLGASLGLAYLSKAAMFPLALVFLAVAAFSSGNWQRGLPRALVAALAFAVAAGPFAAALSIQKGRPTFGDAGGYVYVTFVNPRFDVVPLVHWQGEPLGFGTPEHPTRQISQSPTVYEFTTPVAGTYPPWYDPSYWYAGLEPELGLERQIEVLITNLDFIWSAFLGLLTFGFLALVCGPDRFSPSLAALRANWRLLVPAAIGIGLYCMATDLVASDSDLPRQPAMRYIAPFVVLLFAGVFASIRLPNTRESKQWLTSMTVAVLLVVGASLITNPVRDRLSGEPESAHRGRIAMICGRGNSAG